MKIEPLNESSLLVSFSDEISEPVLDLIRLFCQQLMRSSVRTAIIELVPSYNTVMLVYRLTQTDYDSLHRELQQCYQQAQRQSKQLIRPRVVELPVFYSETTGPDLARISQQTGLSVQDIINRHTQTQYRVYAIGFSPGFPYLASVDSLIAQPRLTAPRKNVPAGSVGIADTQTGIYPKASPGGWNIIGNCPEPLLDSQLSCRLNVGDTVQFVTINEREFVALGGKITVGFNEL
ncbi:MULTISPECIES: 5-oxoprolinase subunit PxpB [unclassified Motilimonas]|uniref:5-oxoprolinase subunit PxpB n=1 Tax=unclassified Motilimonas TaxID=2643697 RepID=UPI001E33ED74|nr:MULTISPECIES: 5-oxoprolinase subunit PxpB [unclassified Motilimonas]MCE0557619.1 5-oxoprolinase subunit PxpB [Motilimonas sp. E26]MDO6526296.1 5-oxoprolinase subunit PxpB [Motilimonas sp. 1_MG-2023]